MKVGKIAIKVKLASREYPLSIDAAEEAAVRQIVKTLDEQFSTYTREFPFRDTQDILAMAAISVAGDLAMRQTTNQAENAHIHRSLKALNQLLQTP